MAKTITGRKSVWQVLESVGKGDAGEVLRVQTDLGIQQGVMKRPVQNVSGGTIVRQAMQIENEGRVLALLDGLDVERHGQKIHTPLLMDQSLEGTSTTANLFIVSEEVSGVSVSELLRRKLQGGAPLSQALILKILAATFLLLQNIHEKGIIWNDVKMDHIFWDAETNIVSFIDWGNSLELNDQAPENKASHLLDYQQLLEEGRALLEQTSPELIADIGWPLSASNLNDLEIHHLQMRVEYMESYLSMRIIEYKLLFGRYLKSLDSIDGLEQTLELMHSLKQLGVEVDLSDLLSASQSFLLALLDRGENKQAQKVFALLEAELSQDLSPNWQLSGYLLNHRSDSDPGALASLLKAMFESNWTDAAWIYRESFLAEQTAAANDPVINSMRNVELNFKAYNLIFADLMALYQQSERWLETAIQKQLDPESISTLQNLTTRIRQILSSWQHLQPNEKLGDKFLLLRQVLESLNALQLRPANDLQTSLLSAMSRIREIYRAWAACDLSAAGKQTRQLFLLEPTLNYLPELAADFEKMSNWLEILNQGPAEKLALNKFAAELLESLPPLAERLGNVPWLTSLVHALTSMRDALAIENLREEARAGQWPMPWLDLQSLQLEISESYRQSVQLDASQKTCLAEYHQALKASLQPSGPLKKIRQQLPAFHQAYSDLAAAFAAVFSQLRGEATLPELDLFPPEDQQQVEEVQQILKTIRKWKEHIQSGSPAKYNFPEALSRHWHILDETQSQYKTWRDELLPKLSGIKQKRWEEFPVDLPFGNNDPIALARAALAKLQLDWKRIPEQGLFPELIEEMIYQIDTAQSHFFKFWQSLQSNNSVVTRWLSGIYQPQFSETNQNMLQISRNLRSVQLAFKLVNEPEMARTRAAQNSAGELMYNLVQLDTHIMPQSRKPSIFRSWQHQFIELLQQGDRRHILESIQTIEAIHPLLPWFDELVRRDADYFNLPGRHQW